MDFGYALEEPTAGLPFSVLDPGTAGHMRLRSWWQLSALPALRLALCTRLANPAADEEGRETNEGT